MEKKNTARASSGILTWKSQSWPLIPPAEMKVNIFHKASDLLFWKYPVQFKNSISLSWFWNKQKGINGLILM